MFNARGLRIANKDVLPIIEGGKGVAISTGVTSGHWARCGGIGTVSAVNADFYDENGNIVRQVYTEKNREDRHKKLIEYAIKGGISQIKIASDIAEGNGAINMNVLWGMGGVEEVLCGIMDKVKDLVNGITCGAGMPYKLAEIAARYSTYYYPIISSARAFKILYKRSFSKFTEWLGGVVYEDPWLAGGHVGLSNAEDPTKPEAPYNRVKALRQAMSESGLGTVPIIIAGGVWWLSEWQDWIDNPAIGPVAFQFGSRPLVTQESPISDEWKQLLLHLRKEDIILNKFSPTGFYSSAVKNPFITELLDRSTRQVKYSDTATEELNQKFEGHFISESDLARAKEWASNGFSAIRTTPDHTLLFVTPEKARTILAEQMSCSGCLSACTFSGWNESGPSLTPDPRTFCIQKTLQSVAHDQDVENNLVFTGGCSYRFSEDPFYHGGFIPNIKQLVDRIMTGF